MKYKNQISFKSYKSDAAPFFFYFDIFPLDFDIYRQEHLKEFAKNIDYVSIMPLPIRIDKIFNGRSSILIRPLKPVEFEIGKDLFAIINPHNFLQYGLNTLIQLCEVRSLQTLHKPLRKKNVKKWWENTRFTYGEVYQLEIDFSAFLRAYLHTMVKAQHNDGDLITAARNYCQIIAEVCENRLKSNFIKIKKDDQYYQVRLYVKKKRKIIAKWKSEERLEYNPELIDIKLYDFITDEIPDNERDLEISLKSKIPKILKYIPMLIYDDLLECMLQNLLKLEEQDSVNIIEPKILIKKKIIKVYEKSQNPKVKQRKIYSWLNQFDSMNIKMMIE